MTNPSITNTGASIMPVFSNLAIDTNKNPLDAAKLNWTVEKEQLYLKSGEPTSAFALIRSDTKTAISVVSKRYKPIQNHTIVDIVNRVLEPSKGVITHGGTMRNGRDIVLFGDLHLQDTVGRGNEVKMYALAKTGHYPGASLQIMLSIVHVICTNQFTPTYDIDKKGVYSCNHATYLDDIKANQAIDLLSQAKEFLRNYKEHAKLLMSQHITDDYAENFIDKHFGNKKDPDKSNIYIDGITNLLYSPRDLLLPPSCAGEMTKWSLWNAITQFLDHRSERYNRTALIGQAADKKRSTFNALVIGE